MFLVAFTFVLSSCKKDKDMDELIDQPNTETPTTFNSFSGMVSSATTSSTVTDSTVCYEIDFPLTFILEDGSTATAQNEDDLENIFDSEPYPVDWEYPINLVDPETGETAVANDEVELANYIIGCLFEEWGEEGEGHDECDSLALGYIDCYDIVYPFTFVLEDGSHVTVQDESELDDIIFSNNPPEDFVYPIELIDEDGEVHLVESEEDLEDLLDECEEEEEFDEEGIVYIFTLVSTDLDAPEVEACYNYVYPVSVMDDDGEVLSANSDDELFDLLEENDYLEDFVYPLSVIELETGETLTINDEEEAWELIEDCLP